MDSCEDVPLADVQGVVKVKYQPPPDDWHMRGGLPEDGGDKGFEASAEEEHYFR